MKYYLHYDNGDHYTGLEEFAEMSMVTARIEELKKHYGITDDDYTVIHGTDVTLYWRGAFPGLIIEVKPDQQRPPEVPHP